MHKLFGIFFIIGTYFQVSKQKTDYIKWYEETGLCKRKSVRYALNLGLGKLVLIPVSSEKTQFSVEINFSEKLTDVISVRVLHEKANQTDRIGSLEFDENIYVGYPEVKLINESLIKFTNLPMKWQGQRIILIYYLKNPISHIPLCFQIPFPNFAAYVEISCPKETLAVFRQIKILCRLKFKGKVPKITVNSLLQNGIDIISNISKINEGSYAINISGMFEDVKDTIIVGLSEGTFYMEKNITISNTGHGQKLFLKAEHPNNYCQNSTLRLSCFINDVSANERFRFIGPNNTFVTEKYGGFKQSIILDVQKHHGKWECYISGGFKVTIRAIQHVYVSDCPFTVQVDNKPAETEYIFGTRDLGKTLKINCSKIFYIEPTIYRLLINSSVVTENKNGHFTFTITLKESFTLCCEAIGGDKPWREELNFKYIRIGKPTIKYNGKETSSIYFHKHTKQPIEVQCSSEADEEIIYYRLVQNGTSRGSVKKDGNFIIPFRISSDGRWECVAESVNTISDGSYLQVSVAGADGVRYFTEIQKIILSISGVFALILMVITILMYRYL